MNADEPTMLGLGASNPSGANLFAYCGNNPVMNVDPTGYMELSITNNYFEIRFNDWEQILFFRQ